MICKKNSIMFRNRCDFYDQIYGIYFNHSILSGICKHSEMKSFYNNILFEILDKIQEVDEE